MNLFRKILIIGLMALALLSAGCELQSQKRERVEHIPSSRGPTEPPSTNGPATPPPSRLQ